MCLDHLVKVHNIPLPLFLIKLRERGWEREWRGEREREKWGCYRKVKKSILISEMPRPKRIMKATEIESEPFEISTLINQDTHTHKKESRPFDFVGIFYVPNRLFVVLSLSLSLSLLGSVFPGGS